MPFTIRGRDEFTGFNVAGITDSELTAFRHTNNVTNADLIMELKYSHLESAGGSATHTKEADQQEDLSSIK